MSGKSTNPFIRWAHYSASSAPFLSHISNSVNYICPFQRMPAAAISANAAKKSAGNGQQSSTRRNLINGAKWNSLFRYMFGQPDRHTDGWMNDRSIITLIDEWYYQNCWGTNSSCATACIWWPLLPFLVLPSFIHYPTFPCCFCSVFFMNFWTIPRMRENEEEEEEEG